MWLDPAALVNGDYAAVLDVLERGMNAAEHAEFIARCNRLEAGRQFEWPIRS
ncbi:MAG: hypothetical protein ACLQIB_13370 [Isosphaeraceae bacterium]